jgi:hypothetical protein
MAKGDAMPDRFWQKVDIKEPDECWLWTGALHGKGYGHFRLDGRIEKAHRVAWVLANGLVPDGLTVDHVAARGCTSKACVNPAHLEPVTNRVNTLRGGNACAVNARMTHCRRGHEFTVENTRIETTGSRRCRTCLALRKAERV